MCYDRERAEGNPFGAKSRGIWQLKQKGLKNLLLGIRYMNYGIAVLMTLAYFYQIVYTLVGLAQKRKVKQSLTPAAKIHKFAAVISARNESEVIGELIGSLKRQNYPEGMFDVFVIADNCTDDTAAVSRKAGAIVYERWNQQLVGKGYALDTLF